MARPPSRPTNQDLLSAYLTDAELQGLTTDTCDSYRSSLGNFVKFLGAKHALKVGVPELRDYLGAQRKRQFKPSTLRAHFSAVSSFYDFLAFEGRIPGNPVPPFRKRYFKDIRRDAGKDQTARRQLLSVEDMRRLVHSITDLRDRAYLVLLTKTGARRSELGAVDTTDIDWAQQSITLKAHAKRTNCLVFFDDEAARVLRRWIAVRQARGASQNGPLFTGDQGGRLTEEQASKIVTQAAEAQGLHDPEGDMRKRFTPHCCRHFFTTHLRRAGMQREHIAWLRGDAGKDTMDIYLHVDPEQVRESYRACIPKFGL